MRKIISLTVVLGGWPWRRPPLRRPNTTSTRPSCSTHRGNGHPADLGKRPGLCGEHQGRARLGAVLGHNDFPITGEFQGTFRAFYTKGTLKATLSGSGGPAPGGGISFTGSGQITKGTGKFKGAKGKFTFTGSSPPA